MEDVKVEYKFKVSLSKKKVINFRMWKLKDRKAFKKIMQDEDNENLESDVLNILVKNVIKEDVALSTDELQYLLTEIRKESISDSIKYNWKCTCKADNEETVKLDDINIPKLAEYKTVVIDGVEFIFGDILNKEYYELALKDCDDDEDIIYTDLCYHIHQIGDNIDFSITDMINYIEEMDTDNIDILMEAYNEMKFSTSKIIEFNCKECKIKRKFEFDTIPDFFPESWM